MPKLYLLHHLLDNAVTEASAKEGFIDLLGNRRSFDYASLHAMTTSCAGVLQELGIERRDRVAIYLPKSAEEAAAVFAPSYADGVFVSYKPA